MNLLSVNMDAKTVKGLKKGYLTGILYLSPCPLLCPACSEGCRKACLYKSGHGYTKLVQRARQNKTKIWFNHRERFKDMLIGDIAELIVMAERRGLKPCVRINGTSDIDVVEELGDVLEKFKEVQFYDYTKVEKYLYRPKPDNYYILFSRSENTRIEKIRTMIFLGFNVAVVFSPKPPKNWYGIEVIDGDASDLRFLDKSGVIVGLKAKGGGRKDTSGFVVHVKETENV